MTDAARPAPWVVLDNLTVAFGRRVVLDSLDASLRGRCVGLLGRNGAGKTTLLQTLLGFHRPRAGTAQVFDHDVATKGRQAGALIGYMPEGDSFIAGMSGVRFVRLMAEMSGLPSAEALHRAHEAFFHVGLGEARYRRLETYSLGMKQLAKLAQAIVHGPRLLLLDEPTNGLDPPARDRMLALIRGIRDAGDARLIVSSHLLHDVEACCDEALILDDGRIATYCDIERERRTNRKFLTLEIKGDQERFVAGLGRLGCEVGLANRRQLRAVLPADREVADLYALAASQAVQIRRLQYKRDSLEEVFLRTTAPRSETSGAAVPVEGNE